LIPTERKKDDSGKFKIRRSLLENPENKKWSRPGHEIERNIQATEKAREIRKALK
jgi:hypothetical protein